MKHRWWKAAGFAASISSRKNLSGNSRQTLSCSQYLSAK